MSEAGHDQEAPRSVGEWIERLDATKDELPKRLRQCADFSRRHLHLIAVSTVSQMAAACDVVPSVYMRFCQALGFSGYSQMQALFRARYTEFRPDYEERLAALRNRGATGIAHLLPEFAEAGHKSLLALGNSVTGSALERTARDMAEARIIHLVGLRRAFAVVNAMAYTFDQLGIPAMLHYGAGMLNSGKSILAGDVLFAATYAPFSVETIRLAEAAAGRGIGVYGLTDSVHCPVSDHATEMLFAREEDVAGFRSLNASMTLTTALAVAVKAIRAPA